ncbi:MAG: hypothetical protein IKU64_00770 [Bacteroides sp.]|nr:hypothetical protein [Bacteroides sp.]
MVFGEFYMHILILFLLLLICYVVDVFTGVCYVEMLKPIGSILAVMVGLIVYKAQKRVLTWNIRDRLICELKEMYRHLDKNLEVLEVMQQSEEKPSMMHIDKLKIDDHMTLTDAEIMKNMSKKYTAIVFPLTIRMRNYNITVDYLKTSLEENNKVLFKSYIEEMVSITKRVKEIIYKDSMEYLVYDVIKELESEEKKEQDKTLIKNEPAKKQRKIVFVGDWGS